MAVVLANGRAGGRHERMSAEAPQDKVMSDAETRVLRIVRAPCGYRSGAANALQIDDGARGAVVRLTACEQ
jgi:hypothetical protein